MVEKNIYFQGKAIKFDCEIKDKQVHLSPNQLVMFHTHIMLELADYIEKHAWKQPTVEDYGKGYKSPPDKPTPSEVRIIPEGSDKPVYSDAQKAAMKQLKINLKIKKNSELNPYVDDWSVGKMKTYKDLTPETLNNFLDYMKKEAL